LSFGLRTNTKLPNYTYTTLLVTIHEIELAEVDFILCKQIQQCCRLSCFTLYDSHTLFGPLNSITDKMAQAAQSSSSNKQVPNTDLISSVSVKLSNDSEVITGLSKMSVALTELLMVWERKRGRKAEKWKLETKIISIEGNQ
jgi:hypothetical protein